eukprot:gene4679-5289_t
MSEAILDSIRSASKSQFKLKNTPQTSHARFHKGFGLVAASSSIPSKYQTVVIDNSEHKGFGSASRRFHYDDDTTEGPAPAHYQVIQNMTRDQVSLSKKGTGGFASQVKRFPKFTRHNINIAPGQYNPLPQSKSYFNKANCTSNFHLPIATNTDEHNKKYVTPAPNHYDIPHNVTGRVAHENHTAACAAFKSRSRRDLLNIKSSKNVPAPGTYNVNESLIKSHARETTAPFRSKTNRELLAGRNSFPGPGAYRPFEPVEYPDRKQLPRKHYLCISAPAMPLPPTPPAPGPGHYNLVDYSGPTPKFVSSSMFVSTTGRLNTAAAVTSDSLYEPGPATYNPQGIGKQSFIFNTDKKWI